MAKCETAIKGDALIRASVYGVNQRIEWARGSMNWRLDDEIQRDVGQEQRGATRRETHETCHTDGSFMAPQAYKGNRRLESGYFRSPDDDKTVSPMEICQSDDGEEEAEMREKSWR